MSNSDAKTRSASTQEANRPYCRAQAAGVKRLNALRQKSARDAFGTRLRNALGTPSEHLGDAFLSVVLLLFEELRERRVDIGNGARRLRGEGRRGIGCAPWLCGQGDAVVFGRQDRFARNASYGCARIQVDDFEVDLFFGHRVSQTHDDALFEAFAVEHGQCRCLLCVGLGGGGDDVFAPCLLLCLTVSVGVDLRRHVDDLVGSIQLCCVAGVDRRRGRLGGGFALAELRLG